MALFDTLPPAQQQLVISALQMQVRPITGANARALTGLAQVYVFYQTNLAPILAGIDSTEVIPDASGLAGAQAVTVGDLAALMSAAGVVLAAQNTPAMQALYAKLAGLSVLG